MTFPDFLLYVDAGLVLAMFVGLIVAVIADA